MLLQLILLATTCGLLYFTRRQNAFSPVRMFLYGWLAVLGTASSGMVIYARPLAVSTFLLVLATLYAFVVGVYLATGSQPSLDGRLEKSERDIRIFGQPRDDIDRLALGLLCSLAVIGAAFVIRDLLGGGYAVLANFATESSRVRNDYWAEFAAGNLEVSPIRSIGTVSCLCVATLLPYATRCRRRLLQIASAASAIVVAIDSFLSAGRFTLGVLALCLLVSATLVYGGESLKRVFTLRRVLIGGAIAFYFFIVFPTQRNPELADSVERTLWFLGDARLAGWVKDIAAVPGMGWLEIFAYSTSYYSGALDKLNYFVTETAVFQWHQFGLYNITQISQVSGALTGGVTPWHQIRLDIAELMSHEGWAVNPWSTAIRDFGIDFGLVAVPIAGILGFVAQKAYARSLASRSFIGLITASYISIACLVFAFISPFQIRIISNGFWLLAAVAIARYLISQAIGRRRSTSGSVGSVP